MTGFIHFLFISHSFMKSRSTAKFLHMDDEISRAGIKEELTTRDTYLEKEFRRLSKSGHDLTPLSTESTKYIKAEYPQADFNNEESIKFLGFQQKGLYASDIGGLPLFASGSRLDKLCNRIHLYFTEPCDSDHIYISNTTNICNLSYNNNSFNASAYEVHCTRSNNKVGKLILNLDSNGSNGECRNIYEIESNKVRFLPLNKPFPVESQPENYWGSEGQYCAWNQHERIASPLSY